MKLRADRTRHDWTRRNWIRLSTKRDDRGAALPIVLVIVMVLSVVVISVATYVAADLRYSRVTADRAARLASADAVMNYAVDQLKLRNAACLLGGSGGVPLPGLAANLNGATATVSCQRVGGGVEDIQAWAAVVTGDGGLTGSDYLLSTQSGNAVDKLLGGPVYMARATANAFSLGPNVKIKDGPLYNYDPTCTTPITTSNLPSQMVFEPNLIYGPICTTVPWTTLFADPVVPDLTASPLGDPAFPNQSLAVPPWFPSGTCRVFSPGVYTAMPAVGSASAYFKSGNYYFLNVDFQVGSAMTAGYADNRGIAPNEIANPDCDAAQAADIQPPDNAGATFYFGGSSHITVTPAGSLEINLRKQGTNYVSLQTLCNPLLASSSSWCSETGGPTGVRSTLTGAGTDAVVYTQPGNKKQFVTHGLLYAPTARLEFGNATNSAEQKILGGLVVARLVLQSSASATNFAIQVATSPINVTVLLTATATKNGGTTTIRAVIDYRPYSQDIKQRLAISSWRVT